MLSMETRAINKDTGDEWASSLHYMSIRAMGIYHERWIWINLSSSLVNLYITIWRPRWEVRDTQRGGLGGFRDR